MSDVSVELQRHPFLAGMPPEHYATLAALARYAEYPAGAVLFPEGDTRGEFFLLISGRVALEIVSQGQSLRIETLDAGTALGWSAVLLGRGKHFQARALEPVKALVLLGPEVLQRGNPWAYELLRARGNTIEGGTTEILKNIVAERVLGLPKAR